METGPPRDLARVRYPLRPGFALLLPPCETASDAAPAVTAPPALFQASRESGIRRPEWTTGQERRVGLLLGKRAVFAHRFERSLTAEMDENQQRHDNHLSRSGRCRNAGQPTGAWLRPSVPVTCARHDLPRAERQIPRNALPDRFQQPALTWKGCSAALPLAAKVRTRTRAPSVATVMRPASGCSSVGPAWTAASVAL
jgi:hypothetical protein